MAQLTAAEQNNLNRMFQAWRQDLGFRDDVLVSQGFGDLLSAASTPPVVAWTQGQAWASVYPLIQAAVAASGACIVQLVSASGAWVIDNTFPTVNFDGVFWIGSPVGAGSAVTINAGVTLGGAKHLIYSRYIFWVVAGTLYNGPDAVTIEVEFGSFQAVGGTAVPAIINTTSGVGSPVRVIAINSNIIASAASPLFQFTSNGFFIFTARSCNTIGTNNPWVAGPVAGPNMQVTSVVSAESNAIPVAGMVSGNATFNAPFVLTSGALVKYAPAVAGNWAPAPTAVAGALDQLAPLTMTPVADPGNAGAIPVTKDAVCNLVGAGAETRSVAAPAFAGQQLVINSDTAPGNIVVTVAGGNFDATHHIATFTAAAQALTLVGVTVGGVLRWSLQSNNGTTLS